MSKNLVEHIVKSLVTNPDEVAIQATATENKVAITIKVNPHDLGRVIGKEGQTIRAIRTLVFAAVPGCDISVDVLK